MITDTVARSRGLWAMGRYYAMAAGLMMGVGLSAPSMADPQADPIGALILQSGASASASDSSSALDLSDPIGQLITQAKQERAKMDASIGTIDLSPTSELAQAALGYLGVRYRYGGTSPSSGFDCSGLIHYLAKNHLGMDIPRVSAAMAKIGTEVARDELQPGDLVFFNTRGARNSHVGIYLGNNEFVHAPRTGTVVRVEKISAYWDKRWNGARRLDGTPGQARTQF